VHVTFATQALNILTNHAHAELHYVSAHCDDPLCGHIWLADGIIVLLHASGLQELLHVIGTRVGELCWCMHLPSVSKAAPQYRKHYIQVACRCRVIMSLRSTEHLRKCIQRKHQLTVLVLIQSAVSTYCSDSDSLGVQCAELYS
jgi:hypothetical protein